MNAEVATICVMAPCRETVLWEVVDPDGVYAGDYACGKHLGPAVESYFVGFAVNVVNVKPVD